MARLDLMKTSFSAVLVDRLLLDFECMKPMVNNLRSNAALDMVMLKSLMGIFCRLGKYSPLVSHHSSGIFFCLAVI